MDPERWRRIEDATGLQKNVDAARRGNGNVVERIVVHIADSQTDAFRRVGRDDIADDERTQWRLDEGDQRVKDRGRISHEERDVGPPVAVEIADTD